MRVGKAGGMEVSFVRSRKQRQILLGLRVAEAMIKAVNKPKQSVMVLLIRPFYAVTVVLSAYENRVVSPKGYDAED